MVDVARFELHLQAAGFQGAVGEEILDELLQSFAARLHVAQHFPLPRIHRSQLLALQQLHVAVQNRQRGLQIMRRGPECVGRPLEPLLQVGVSLL